jgi:hypothetical protein
LQCDGRRWEAGVLDEARENGHAEI